LDRDDILDITDFDVVAFMKKEMRMKLEEELARAMLIGDGRDPLAAGNDKIKENHIRPVFNDSDLYTIKAELPAVTHKLGEAHDVIRTVIKAMSEYEGKGQPMMFCHPDLLADMLLIEDENGRFIYENEAVLARTLRVREIVPVPLMKGLQRDGKDVKAIVVNPSDYTVGADKGGQVAMFEDFDIDYNQQKYLIETRCSGSLMQPKTAICIEKAK
jgi:HK97 family phage major capsid protein